MSVNTTDWQRRSALFDEVSDLPADARDAWFAALEKSEPRHLAAIKKMLTDFDRTDPRPDHAPSLIGVGAQEFAAKLDVATVIHAGSQVSAGNNIGAWQLERKIGEGGMGAVWLAARHDGNFDGYAAIKFLRTGLGKTEVVERFLRERRLLARLTHPGIARMLDAGTHEGEPYLVMEYVDGLPITEWAASHAPRVADRVALLLKVCRAAEHAHAQLIVHRDLKPSNVLVNSAGEPSLLDFGIAKLIDDGDDEFATALTRITGRGFTLGYCAPEQITGEPTGVAADVFSMGVLLFELLTGTLPFKSTSNSEGRAALEHAIVHTEAKSLSRALSENSAASPKRPDDAARAKGDLEAIVAKALRKKPADRYPTLSAFSADLERWLNNLPVAARRGNWQYKTGLWLKRNRTLAAVASIAFVAVSAGLFSAMWQADRANAEAVRADMEKETAIQQRRRAEIATAQAEAALTDANEQKTLAAAEAKRADQEANEAKRASITASKNEQRAKNSAKESVAASALAKGEAARATKVADYLGELIQSASPDNHGGKWPTVLALLEQSEKDIDKQFADDPKSHALLLQKLADTNDALNRNAVALAQLTQLQELLTKIQGVDSDAALDAAKQRAQILRRMNRHRESMAIDEALLPKFAARYGKNSEEYGNLMMGTMANFAEAGRMSEARQRMIDGAAILTKLNPNDLAKRIDLVNDTAVLFTRQAMWREAMDTLATIESDLPAFSKLGGQKIRDALIMRRNLEAIRIRVGRYDGVEARLRQILNESNRLLGDDNVQSESALSSLRSLACETGRFADCLALSEELVRLHQRRQGKKENQDNYIGDALETDVVLLTHQLNTGRTPSPLAAAQLQRFITEIPLGIKEAGAERAELYRLLSDAATAANMLSIADTAQQRAREDLAKINNANPERAAQVDRAAALTTFVRGDAQRAVQLLETRFKRYEASAEGDSPRRAALWLQRALYELEFDNKAAAISLAESRAIFARVGGAQIHFKALIGYVEARITGNATSIRAAEEAVDQVWTRPRPSPWRAPFMTSQ